MKSAASDMPASHFADALQARESMIGKGANATGDIVDVAIDGMSSIAEFFAPS
jgi:hypothetical protein